MNSSTFDAMTNSNNITIKFYLSFTVSGKFLEMNVSDVCIAWFISGNSSLLLSRKGWSTLLFWYLRFCS